MKVLLVHPPWLRFFGRSLSVPPISLNHIASYIRRKLPQFTVDVYNADHSKELYPLFSSYLYAIKHQDYVQRLKNMHDPIWQEVKKVISHFNPDILGISSMTASFVSALQVSMIAKQINPNMLVVFGGKHPTALPTETLKNESIDYVVIGEGEVTFKDLLLNLNKPETVPGIAYRNSNGDVLTTAPRAYIDNIDKLPIPIFESSINRYDFEKKINLESYKWRIVSARGCPFNCIYCASDKTVRFRSPENVAEEVFLVKRNYGINHFCFEDDSFSINRKRALDLCRQLKYENVRWECNTRIDLIDEELVSTMKKSGCTLVSIGIETGSYKTLRMINKKITFQMISQAIHLLRKYRIFIFGYFIIGFPWETRTDMEQTLNLIQKLPIDDFELNIATPLPGTKMFKSLVESGKINIASEDWSRYHQGSPNMNFSEYSDAEWREMILEFTLKASKLYKQRIFKKTFKMFLQDPITTCKRIKNRIRDSRQIRKLPSIGI